MAKLEAENSSGEATMPLLLPPLLGTLLFMALPLLLAARKLDELCELIKPDWNLFKLNVPWRIDLAILSTLTSNWNVQLHVLQIGVNEQKTLKHTEHT